MSWDSTLEDTLTDSWKHVAAAAGGIRGIDQSFGVDHNNDLWPAEDEEGLWGRSEDDSKTNTDSEAEDAPEFMLAFA